MGWLRVAETTLHQRHRERYNSLARDRNEVHTFPLCPRGQVRGRWLRDGRRSLGRRESLRLCLLATLVAGIHCAPARTCGPVAGDALGWGRRRVNGWWRGRLVWVLVAGRIQHRSERSETKGGRIPEAASRG